MRSRWPTCPGSTRSSCPRRTATATRSRACACLMLSFRSRRTRAGTFVPPGTPPGKRAFHPVRRCPSLQRPLRGRRVAIRDSRWRSATAAKQTTSPKCRRLRKRSSNSGYCCRRTWRVTSSRRRRKRCCNRRITRRPAARGRRVLSFTSDGGWRPLLQIVTVICLTPDAPSSGSRVSFVRDDPRPSLEERYGSHAGYVAAVKAAANNVAFKGLPVCGTASGERTRPRQSRNAVYSSINRPRAARLRDGARPATRRSSMSPRQYDPPFARASGFGAGGFLQLSIATALAAGMIVATSAADARTTSIQILSRGIAFGGHSFPGVGQYEFITGIATGEVDPSNPQNAVITDIGLAPVDGNGNVAYRHNFYILKPLD